MIIITAKFVVKPEAIDQFLPLAAEMLAETRKEEGNHYYHLFRDRKDPMSFCFIEHWENDAAIAAHNSSAHFTTLIPQMVALGAAAPEISMYEAAEID